MAAAVRKKSKEWLFSFLHAFVLLGLTAGWMFSYRLYGDEEAVIRWATIIRHDFLPAREVSAADSVLFIDLSYDKAVLMRDDCLGSDVITDRQQLATFFRTVSVYKKDIRFIVCDVVLDRPTAEDGELRASLGGFQKVVFAEHYNKEGILERSKLPVPQALTNYERSDEKFLKFQLFQTDSVQSLPVYLYEQLNGHRMENTGLIPRDNGRPVMNNLITDLQLREVLPHVTLSELLSQDTQTIKEMVSNKILIMSDLRNDVHPTVFGNLPGGLIMYNVYLSLSRGAHLISVYWLVFLMTFYTILSKIILFHRSRYKKKKLSWLGPLIESATFLTVLSLISYLCFDRHIQVAFLTIYLNLALLFLKLRTKPLSAENYKRYFSEIKNSFF